MPRIAYSKSQSLVLTPLPFFESVKTAQPIETPSELHYQALIQKTLDPDVTRIEPGPRFAVGPGSSSGRQALARLWRQNVVLALHVHMGPNDPPDIASLGARNPSPSASDLPVEVLTAAQIRQEPTYSNSRLVWECRNFRVTASDRVRVLLALTENGPLSLVDTSSALLRSTDPISAVLALACQGMVEVDLSQGPISPETQVRRSL